MEKKSSLVMVSIVLLFVFCFTAQGFGCDPKIVGIWQDSSENVRGFVYDVYLDSYQEIIITGVGATTVRGRGINDENYCVGDYVNSSGTHGFLYDLDDDTFTTIDYPGSSYTRCWGVNDSNYIVGEYQDSSGDNHGFYYNGTTFTSFDYPDANFTRFHDLNEDGNMVMRWDNTNDTVYAGYYDSSYYFTVLPANASSCSALGINDNGVISGWYTDSSDSNNYGFTYDGSTFTKIQYPNMNSTNAQGVNTDLQVAGSYVDSGVTKAFFKSGTTYTQLVPDSNAIFTYACDISNKVY